MESQRHTALEARTAHTPFYFNSAMHLVKVESERAHCLGELLDSIRVCSDASIFQHAYQTLAEHHFIRQGFSNDFAHWIFSACNEASLAEQLASVDVRNFISIGDLRAELVRLMESYLGRAARSRNRPAAEPFFFCASELFLIPTPFIARDLAEFVTCVHNVSVHSIQYHFIDARLRLRLNSNDFSQWLDADLDLSWLAARLNRIDIYTQTLDGVRRSIERIVEDAL